MPELATIVRPTLDSSQPHAQPPPPPTRVDPYALLAADLSDIRHTTLNLLGSAHPSLTEIANYYFLQPSKQLRPLLVLLFARACNGLGSDWRIKRCQGEYEGRELDMPPTRSDVPNGWNPNLPEHTASSDTVFSLSPPRRLELPHIPEPLYEEHIPSIAGQILPAQTRLAQIVEVIHVASLLHDDVLDESPLRRSAPSAPAKYGNKLSVLAGDFLICRAFATLSRIGNIEVVELFSSACENLVEGEILQIKDVHGDPLQLQPGQSSSRLPQEVWSVYLRKCYLKTASLMAAGVRAAVILGGVREGELWKEVAYAYGRNMGIAFQLVDDVLDYEEGDTTLGKPGGADLKLGLATAPALYAWEENEAMGPLIKRKFNQDGDVELARELVRRSSGVQRTWDLARTHADKALEALAMLPDSDAKAALFVLTERVVQRKCSTTT